MPLKQKSASIPRNLALETFGELQLVFSTKVNLLYLLYSMAQKGWSSAFHKAKLFSRINLKLHNISVTPIMVKKVITNLDLSQVYGPECIPVVVLKTCEPELSFVQAGLFNMCLKKPCFKEFWKVSLVIPVFKDVQKSSTAKNYCPAGLLYVVSKVFKVQRNVALFLISSVVLSFLNQLQIF